jgi:hypothetical protein
MPDATLAALGEVLDVGSVHRADAYGFEAWSTVGMLRWVYDDEGGEGLMTTAAVQRWYEVHSMIAGNDTNQAAFVGRAFGAGPLGEQLEAAARLGDAVRAELGVPRHAVGTVGGAGGGGRAWTSGGCGLRGTLRRWGIRRACI